MAPHLRHGLLFAAACLVVGAAMGVAARYADGSAGAILGPPSAALVRIELADTSRAVSSQEAGEPDSEAKLASVIAADPDPTLEVDAEPAGAGPSAAPVPQGPQMRATSIFRTGQRGSLACRIPGGNDFVVEWDSGNETAVAHFSGVAIPGSMAREPIPTSNILDSRVEFSREQDGHRFSMTIDDSGEMRASVDGRESTGTCNRV